MRLASTRCNSSAAIITIHTRKQYTAHDLSGTSHTIFHISRVSSHMPRMHAKTKTQPPRSKPTMSLFPNILHPSTYSTILVADRPKITTPPTQTDHKAEHQHTHQVDHHHVSAFLISFFSHMFAPAAYQQCTSSTPCWALSHHVECSRSSRKAVIIVDDEFVLLEAFEGEEEDGGPICREATIESWKVPRKEPKRSWDARRWSDLPYFGCP
ncbi:uncharacterized protein EKO05_0003801 [Ascochyta rabiei]|uniref:uncharacterized protein n=1 Tax=Didymella rabiei TaxID=5454 RepID=UPI0021FC2118|nr:uncharacterized protein EKO05_0003801 [Ascochyta rabiei]UPX13285.1 hypothetical protein EKO05_0003801 [Ascochyta rabiei]